MFVPKQPSTIHHIPSIISGSATTKSGLVSVLYLFHLGNRARMFNCNPTGKEEKSSLSTLSYIKRSIYKNTQPNTQFIFRLLSHKTKNKIITFHCRVLFHQVHIQHHPHPWDLQIPKTQIYIMLNTALKVYSTTH